MNKFYLTLLAIATTVCAAFAEVVTIDFTDTEQLAAMGYTAPTTGSIKIANGSEFKQGNFTFTSVSGNSRIFKSTAAATPGLEFRGYKGGSLKFSAAEGLAIKKIEFTGALLTNPVTASVGSFALGEKSGNFHTATWIGDDAEITFDLGGNMTITKMVVTLDTPSPVRYPAITPNGGIYYSGMTAPVAVTITTPAEGTKVMYKTTQAPEYQEYTAPISVAESTVVTAKTVSGEAESIEVSSTFTVYPATGVASVAEFNALEDGTNAYFTVPLYVCHQQADAYGKYVIATDGSGYVVLQGDIAKTVSNGDKLPAGVGGQVTINTDSYYNRTLKLVVSTVKDATPSHAVLPETVTVSQITEAYDSHYVYIKNVTVTPAGSYDAIFADATGSISAYDLMSTFPSPLAGTYNITGVVTVEASKDGNTLKVYPISFEAVESTFTFIDFSNTEQFGITAPASGKYVNIADGTSFTVDGITFTSVKKGSTATRFYNSTAKATPGVELRIYKNGQFKVAAPEGMGIRKIVFKGATIFAPEVSCGVFTLGAKMDGFFEAEWVGDDNEVTFTATAGNLFLKTATIYLAPLSPVRYPKFAQSSETFIEGVNTPGIVTITSATEGATIKYRLNDSAEYIDYTEVGVRITGTTTIHAKAVKDAAESIEMTYEVTVITPDEAANVTELLALDNNRVARLNTEVVVTYQQNDKYGNYIFATDGTKSFVIKGITDTYAKGDKLAAGLVGTVSTGDYTYNKVLVPFTETLNKADVATVTPIVATAAEIAGDANKFIYEYVHLIGVKITNASTAYNYVVKDNSGEIPAYDAFSTVPSSLPEGNCDVYAIVTEDFGTMKLHPIEIATATGVEGVTNLTSVVLGANGALTVITPEAAKVAVYSANGQLVSETQAVEGVNTIAAAPGMYIVKVGAEVTKVLVK